MKVNSFKCPLCPKKYVSKQSLYDHLDSEHKEQLNGLSPAHFYFDWRNKNTTHKGKCIQCGKPTEFNEDTEKYDRLCSEKCKKAYREEFKKRMLKKYGKTTLLNDPEQQKKMLANRKISGTYIWTDGTKFTYTGTYEKDCLEYLDKILQFKSTDIMFPAPQIFKYKSEGKEHFYIPDGYIVPYKIIIEVKGTNNHYQQRDYETKEKIKDKILTESQEEFDYTYVKVINKNYDDLLETIENIRNGE